jgi:hypothetical protein
MAKLAERKKWGQLTAAFRAALGKLAEAGLLPPPPEAAAGPSTPAADAAGSGAAAAGDGEAMEAERAVEEGAGSGAGGRAGGKPAKKRKTGGSSGGAGGASGGVMTDALRAEWRQFSQARAAGLRLAAAVASYPGLQA